MLTALNPKALRCPSSLVGKEGTQEGPQDLRGEPCIPGPAISDWGVLMLVTVPLMHAWRWADRRAQTQAFGFVVANS
jgi:hypothetical protein